MCDDKRQEFILLSDNIGRDDAGLMLSIHQDVAQWCQKARCWDLFTLPNPPEVDQGGFD